jgi:hypothetical protein
LSCEQKDAERFEKRRIRREQRKQHLGANTIESLREFRYENIQILGNILSSCYLYVLNSK